HALPVRQLVGDRAGLRLHRLHDLADGQAGARRRRQEIVEALVREEPTRDQGDQQEQTNEGRGGPAQAVGDVVAGSPGPRPGPLHARTDITLGAGHRILRTCAQAGGYVVVLRCENAAALKIRITIQSRKPTTPRISPAIASPPPVTAPPLCAMRLRAMKPMIAATGPRITPQQSRDSTPTISEAIASPSVRGAA